MLVASIGMQFFNNYANNEKNKEIQAHQREFQKAAAEHDFERMRRAQAAAAKLALELEAEVHQERMKEIEDSYNSLLANFAHSFTISNWPLNVLPFIMKGESFGSLFGGSAKSINMHCIFTPSNCSWFNESLYDDLDLRVEAEMNNTWNAQSTHPVVYYGGGWNRRQEKPNGRSIPSLIDLDDITLLKNKLEQIPTMVITPYFSPYLFFRVQLWGMGKDSDDPIYFEIPQGEIEPSQRIFSYDYSKEVTPELTDEFFNITMEEFVPYLTCLIGFIADYYFLRMYNSSPILISMLDKKIKYKKIKELYVNRYLSIASETISSKTAKLGDFTKATKIINEISSCNLANIQSYVDAIHRSYLNYCGGKEVLNLNNIDLLSSLHNISQDSNTQRIIEEEIKYAKDNQIITAWYCASKNELYQRICNVSDAESYDSPFFKIKSISSVLAIGYFFREPFTPLVNNEGGAFYVICINKLLLGQNSIQIYDLDNNSITTMDSDQFTDYPPIDEKYICGLFDERIILQKTLERTYKEAKMFLISELEEAPIVNINYKNILEWADRNTQAGQSSKIIVGYNVKRGVYCIVGICDNDPNIFAYNCNTLDSSIVNKLNGNSIIIIKK